MHDHGATARTDVTGFSLLLGAIPVLDGALDTMRLGILSSLQPQNLRLRRAIRDLEAFAKDERLPLIFDPETAGCWRASLLSGRMPASQN